MLFELYGRTRDTEDWKPITAGGFRRYFVHFISALQAMEMMALVFTKNEYEVRSEDR